MKPATATVVRLVDEFKIKFGVRPNAILVSDLNSELLKLGTVHGLAVHEVPTHSQDIAVALIHPLNKYD